MYHRNSDRAQALAHEALVLAQEVNDQAGVSNALAILGAIAMSAGRDDQAASYFTESYDAATLAGEICMSDLPVHSRSGLTGSARSE